MSNTLYNAVPYVAPSWMLQSLSGTGNIHNIPTQRVQLGRFPTPFHTFNVFDDLHTGLNFFIKRDDLSSFDLSGNKVRKLEFLLGDALAGDYDSVITIGGIQSNHARSTAVAARQLGFDPFIILRTREPEADPGLVGNLLLDRLIGSKIYQVSPSTYAQLGQARLLDMLKTQLIGEGRRPYIIPVGGSNSLGAWGYIEAVNEIQKQSLETGIRVDHIVFACGSGGTATGIALACRLSEMRCKVHAVGVCDSADYFYKHISEVCTELGVDMAAIGEPREWCNIYEGAGLGYARSTDEELRFIYSAAKLSGIVFDPVYSGKALFQFREVLRRAGEGGVFKAGENVLFLHTGGVLGMYDKAEQLLPIVSLDMPVERMKITLT